MRRRFPTRLLVLLAVLAPASVHADDAIALSGSTRDVVVSAAAAEPSSGDADDEGGPTTRLRDEEREERPARGRRRHPPNNDRRVAEQRGASLERAQRLGLGTRDAAVILLHQTPRPVWVTAAGGARVRDLRWPVDEGGFGRGVGYVRTDRPDVPHNGVDIVAPRGSVIHAAADGIVAYSDNGLRGYGNCVIIVHANGWITLYGHMDRTTVQPGWRVRRGERIGFVGSTGHSQGPHLHFELREDGRPIDPLVHFRGRPWISGRARLNVLRAREDGGHSREHLGLIEPDYEPAAEMAPSRVVTAADRAEARRVEARIRRTARDLGTDADDEPTPERVREPVAAAERPAPRVRETAPAETPRRAETTPRRTEPARRDAPAAEARRTEPVARRAEPARRETQQTARREATPETRRPERTRAAAARDDRGFLLTPPAEIMALLENGPSVGALARIEGRTFETLLFPARDGTIAGGRTRLDLRLENGASLRASADGKVAYVGHGVVGDALSVVIVHRNGFVTVYTGFDRVHVEMGADVLRGAPLGSVREGRVASFELRIRGRRVDPRPRLALAPVATNER